MPPRESFEKAFYRAMRVIASVKSEQEDDLDWEEWNSREEFLLGKQWSKKKLSKHREVFKLHTTCLVRAGGKIIAVECNKYHPGATSYVCRRMQFASSSTPRCVWAIENKGFSYPPTGNVKYVSVQAYHVALTELEAKNPTFYCNAACPRFILDVGECQTLPELLSYRDIYFNSPDSKVEYFVAIKPYVKTGLRQMVAVLYERLPGDAGVSRGTAISFGEEGLHPVTVAWLGAQGIELSGVGHGGPPCDRSGLYELKVSTVKVLSGGPNDPEWILRECGDYFTFDLFIIKKEFHFEKRCWERRLARESTATT